MTILKLANPKRLRDYPRLFFIATWIILLLNLILHRGWIGGLTGILVGGDFISNYAGGILYQSDITKLYDPTTQQIIQSELIRPTLSSRFGMFISPPHVAMLMSWMNHIPLSYAFVGWQILNLLSVVASVYLLFKFIIPKSTEDKGFTRFQLLILVLSSFAFVVGFLAGQNHGLTLLLCTGIISAMLKQKWILAGILGSLLTYKPQFAIGFLIIWIAWKCGKTIISFILPVLLMQALVILAYGLSPYFDYMNFANKLLYLPYAKSGFPISTMATPYTLVASLFPANYAKAIQILFVFVGIAMSLYLFWIAYRSRRLPIDQRDYALILALLFPLIIAPYTLIYDLLFLVPGLIFLANRQWMRSDLILISIGIYLALFILPPIGIALKLALPGLIPLSLLGYLMITYHRTTRFEPGT